MAERSGVPEGTLNKILSGATRYPREENIQALKRALQLEYAEEDPAIFYCASRRAWHTLDDFYALPPERRAELIDGIFYDMSAPSLNHQTILFELGVAFRDYIRRKKLSCRVFVAPCDVCLDQDVFTMMEPDVFIVCDPKKIENGMRVNGPPDLVVEVVSPGSSRHDYFLKLQKYQNAGVKEYWIVDPVKERILAYAFWKDAIPVIYSFGDMVPSQLYPGLEVDFGQIRQQML